MIDPRNPLERSVLYSALILNGRLGAGAPTALVGLRPEPAKAVSAIRRPSHDAGAGE